MLNWLQVKENQLDSFGIVPAEIGAIEKQITDLKVCKRSLLILFYVNRTTRIYIILCFVHMRTLS